MRGSSLKQKELQQFQEQQLANAQNQQKPTTAVSVRPQTFQTDPGTSVSQRQPVPKTPGMMPPGTAGNKKIEKKNMLRRKKFKRKKFCNQRGKPQKKNSQTQNSSDDGIDGARDKRRNRSAIQ